MNPERWQEISPHLDEALSLSEEDRADWLAAFRAQRPELALLRRALIFFFEVRLDTAGDATGWR